MFRLVVALLLIVVSGAVYSVSSDPIAAARRARSRVVTFNIYKGAGSDNATTSSALSSDRPARRDVVGLQERCATTPFNCDDHRLTQGVTPLTGRRWTHVYARLTRQREASRVAAATTSRPRAWRC